jgi:hypothetical protein
MKATRKEVKKWLKENAADYESATELAEAANCEFDLPEDGLDDETHWIWDDVMDAFEKYEKQ